VPDTADTAQAAGQPDNSNDDTTAQQGRPDATQQTDVRPENGTPVDSAGQREASADPWADPDAARKEIEKLRRESAGWRTKSREAEPQLTEYQKWQESQKTEQQKLADAKEAAEQQLTDLRATNARLMAAATHEIPPDLIEHLRGNTEEEINASAEALATFLAEQRRTAPASPRPVESLTPGAAPASSAGGATPDQWIRALTGRST